MNLGRLSVAAFAVKSIQAGQSPPGKFFIELAFQLYYLSIPTLQLPSNHEVHFQNTLPCQLAAALIGLLTADIDPKGTRL